MNNPTPDNAPLRAEAQRVHAESSVDGCRLFDLGRSPLGGIVGQGRASVTEASCSGAVPFQIRRVYYLYDVPADSERGGHSHIGLHEMLVAVAGSVVVEIDDGSRTRRVTLNRPWLGLHIVPGIWRVLSDFSAGSVLLVVTSGLFDEADYVRERADFDRLTSAKTSANR